MKKFIGQRTTNDVIMVRVKGSLTKTANTIKKIEFFDKDEEFPECCEEAIREWATQKQLIEFGYEEEVA